MSNKITQVTTKGDMILLIPLRRICKHEDALESSQLYLITWIPYAEFQWCMLVLHGNVNQSKPCLPG